ncbi:MAG: tetratricopeptide repeat protein, partial [Thermodesulfovibrionales bacterium]
PAVSHYIKALELNPLDPESAYNLGNLYAELDRYDEAIVAYETALTISPHHLKALNNLGAVRHILCDLDRAIDCYNKVIQMDPDNPDAHYNKSLSLLLKGDFKEGWRLYEWRFKRQDYPPRIYPMRLWDGKTLRGSLLIYAEQGLGDTIQFVRYIKLLKDKGLKVFLHCQDELVSLMRHSFDDVCDVISLNDPHPRCNFYFPLMSLPCIFQTDLGSIPSELPYIRPDERYVDKWRDLIGCDGGFKVGIVWAGKPEHKYTRMRSVRLGVFEPIFDIKGISFFSIQKGEASKDAEKYDFIRDYTAEISDFSDTAGLIQNLDLIISIDTSVAHLAGALAKPVWILLPCSPDWRWLLGRDDSPWYKTARLFRQKRIGQWDDVILMLKKEMEALVYQRLGQ